MKKFLLSLGLVAALAAPAAAGRLDDADPSVRAVHPAVAAEATAVDYTATRSIAGPAASVDGRFDKQRGDQGAFFGANGR